MAMPPYVRLLQSAGCRRRYSNGTRFISCYESELTIRLIHLKASIFKARGDCVDTSAGVKPAGKLPDNMNSVVKPSPRELLFIQDNSIGKESVVVSSPAPLSGPVVYELRLAHR